MYIYIYIRMYVLKKIWKKAVFQTKKNKTLSKTLSPKSLPNLPISPTFNIQPLPIFPPFFKNQTEPTKKNTPPTELSRGFPPELQGHPASSSSNPSPSTSTFPRLRALSRPPVGLDPIAWWGGSREGGMEKFFFVRPSQGEWGDFFRGFFGVFKGEFLEFHYRGFFFGHHNKKLMIAFYGHPKQKWLR